MKSRYISIYLVIILQCGTYSFCLSNDFNITHYNAKGDGITNNTKAIQTTINVAFEAGGGTVVVPRGEFITGTIELKSNITLHLERGAILKGIAEVTDENYPRVSPGYESFVSRPDIYPERVLIYAKNAKNVSITGSGTINGNGMAFKLPEGSWQEKRLACINLIRFISCVNVKMHGKNNDEMLKVTNSGHWAVQPMNCDNLHMQYVRIEEYGGITPDALPISDCRNVLVEDCYISCDDDALGLKNGSPEIIVENIIVKRTIFESTNTGFKSGSPQSFGPFRNVQFIGCTFRRLDHSLAVNNYGEHHGFFVGILNGGGSYDGVLIEDCIIESTKMPFAMYIAKIRSGYWSQWWPGKDAVNEFGVVKNITIRNVSYQDPKAFGVLIEGRKGCEIENIILENVYLPSLGGSDSIAVPKEKTAAYPDMARSYGKLPAYGFFIRNVRNISMKNVWSWTINEDKRPCLLAENVIGLDDSGLNKGYPPKNYVPAVSFDIVKEENSNSTYIKANCRDHDGYIKNLKLFLNEKLVGEKKSIPFEWRIENLKKGTHLLKLIALDNKGQTSSVSLTYNK